MTAISPTLTSAIDAFRAADASRLVTEKALNREVEREVKARGTIAELTDLIDILPERYRGNRRIWQKVHEMQNVED